MPDNGCTLTALLALWSNLDPLEMWRPVVRERKGFIKRRQECARSPVSDINSHQNSYFCRLPSSLRTLTPHTKGQIHLHKKPQLVSFIAMLTAWAWDVICAKPHRKIGDFFTNLVPPLTCSISLITCYMAQVLLQTIQYVSMCVYFVAFFASWQQTISAL